MKKVAISNFKHFRELSYMQAKAGFKLSNEGSYLGMLWYILNPLLLFIILLSVFAKRLGEGIPHYPLYLLLGIIIFSFFQKITLESTKIVKENKFIIKSINFKRSTLVASLVLKQLFQHLFEIAIFTCLLIFYDVSVIGIFLYLVILVFLSIFSYGVALIFSSLTIYFNDLANIWNFLVRLIWFATPIFYAIELKSTHYYVNLFNPIYYFIQIARDGIIYGKIPETWIIFGAIGYSFLFFILGTIIFKLLRKKFAELI